MPAPFFSFTAGNIRRDATERVEHCVIFSVDGVPGKPLDGLGAANRARYGAGAQLRQRDIEARPEVSEMQTTRHERADDPDLPLVRLIASGDGDALAALMDRHLHRVTALAGRLTGNAADAEDVAQEVFLRVWRHSAGWKSGQAKYATWLYRVTLNLCHDRLRRRRETDMETMDELPGASPGQEAQLQRADVARRVAEALAALPERQREAVVLSYYQDLGNIEAAEVLEISVEALESLLSRGRRKLRELLRDELDELRGEP